MTNFTAAALFNTRLSHFPYESSQSPYSQNREGLTLLLGPSHMCFFTSSIWANLINKLREGNCCLRRHVSACAQAPSRRRHIVILLDWVNLAQDIMPATMPIRHPLSMAPYAQGPSSSRFIWSVGFIWALPGHSCPILATLSLLLLCCVADLSFFMLHSLLFEWAQGSKVPQRGSLVKLNTKDGNSSYEIHTGEVLWLSRLRKDLELTDSLMND